MLASGRRESGLLRTQNRVGETTYPLSAAMRVQTHRPIEPGTTSASGNKHLPEPELEEVAVRGYGIHCMSRVIESV